MHNIHFSYCMYYTTINCTQTLCTLHVQSLAHGRYMVLYGLTECASPVSTISCSPKVLPSWRNQLYTMLGSPWSQLWRRLSCPLWRETHIMPNTAALRSRNHKLMCTYTYVHNTHTHTYRHTYIRTYVRTYIQTYIHTYVRTYIHTYIHTYIRTYIICMYKTFIEGQGSYYCTIHLARLLYNKVHDYTHYTLQHMQESNGGAHCGSLGLIPK